MGSELLDFKSQENFNFFKFSTRVIDEAKTVLKINCERVLDYAHATVQNMCLLGARLLELKNAKTWQYVINPETGFAFFNNSFAEFCKYAFGFSETKTSDFLRIAQFVQLSGDSVDFIERRYADYNTSQLIELAAVPAEHRVYFSSGMTISEMRLCKDYVKNSAEFLADKKVVGFDLLTKAQEWKNKEETPSNVIPGQIDLEDITDDVTVQENQTSDLDDVGDEEYEDDEESPEHQQYLRETEPWIELTEEKKELAIKITLIDRAGDGIRKRIYEKYQENPPHNSFVNFIKEVYGDSCFGVNFMGQTNYKGYKIEPYRGDWIIFLSWAQVASRIVGFINRGEYYTEENPTSDLDDEEFSQEDCADADDEDVCKFVYEDKNGNHRTVYVDQQRVSDDGREISEPISFSTRKEYDFSTRDNIRAFLGDYKNWHYREDIWTPYTKHCYYYTLPNFDILYAFEVNIASPELLQGIRKYETFVEYYICPRGIYKELCCVFEVAKRVLEKYLMDNRDKLCK